MKKSLVQKLTSAQQNILAAFRLGRIAHAYLFSGPQVEISLNTALWLSKLLNCSSVLQDDGPCLDCISCGKIERCVHPDVMIWMPRGALRIIRIEDVREIQANAYYKPFEGNAKVHIITEAESLHPAAANAFLKILEEPPEMTYFILISAQSEAILPTLLSRCQELPMGVSPDVFNLDEFPECGSDLALLNALQEFSQSSCTQARELIENGLWDQKKDLLINIGASLQGSWTQVMNVCAAVAAQIESELEELEKKLSEVKEDFEKTKEFEEIRKGKIAGEKARVIHQFLKLLLSWARHRYPDDNQFYIYPQWVQAAEESRRNLQRGAPIHWALESLLIRVRMAEGDMKDLFHQEVKLSHV